MDALGEVFGVDTGTMHEDRFRKAMDVALAFLVNPAIPEEVF